MNYRRSLILLILISTLVRILVAAGTELSNDEVYYWTYAQLLQGNYFDHPPVIAWLIRLFTVNLHWQQELLVRLGAIVCAAINTWLMFCLGVRVKNERAGWLAACMFTASVYGSILAGLMILPDAPQMTCWLACLLLMMKIFRDQKESRRMSLWLVLLGVGIGLCIMSKIHGVFLWGGVGLYTLLYKRSLLSQPFLYIGLLCTALIAYPIIAWNISNDFVTYSYQGGRVGFFSHLQPDTFFRQLIGELLYNNPVNVVLIVAALLAIRKTKILHEYAQQKILLLVSLPLVALVWFMSLFKDTLPHWTGPAYTSLIPLAAAYLARRLEQKENQRLIPVSLRVALGLPLALLVLLMVAIPWLPFRMGSSEEQRLGAGDPLLDMSGWQQFRYDFEKLYREDVRKGVMKEGAFITTDYWFPAAHLDYYVCRPTGINLVVAGALNNIHNYAWLNVSRPRLQPGADAYYIAVSNYFDAPPAGLTSLFQHTEPPVRIDQYRQGKVVRYFFIYRLKDYKGGMPASGVVE